MKRSYHSGSQKRKAAEEKERKNRELIDKIPKISDVFGSSSSSVKTFSASASSSTSEIETAASESEQQQESPTDEADERIEQMPNDGSMENFTVPNSNEIIGIDVDDHHDHDEDEQPTIDESTFPEAAFPFPTDAALWKMDNNLSYLQSFWAKNG